jgi:hypothetical protein
MKYSHELKNKKRKKKENKHGKITKMKSLMGRPNIT